MGIHSKRIVQVDEKTGEVQQGCLVWVFHRPKMKEKFFMGIQDAFVELAKDKELTIAPKNVLLFLFGHLDFENYIHIPQSEIAEGLGMDRAAVSRSIKILVNKGILEVIAPVGNVKCYKMNFDYAWKGRAKTLDEHRAERRERRQASRLTVIEGGLAA